ncbi:hypothetical protein D3C81_958140 [compost metagenome]
MFRLVAEPHDFVLDRRTVPRTRAFDHPGEHRRTIQVIRNDLMRLFGSIRQPAGELLIVRFFRLIGKKLRFLIPRLYLRLREIDRILMHPRRRPGFETHQLKAQLLQVLRQSHRRLLVVWATFVHQLAHDDFAAQIRTGRQYHRLSPILRAGLGNYTHTLAILDDQLLNHPLEHR